MDDVMCNKFVAYRFIGVCVCVSVCVSVCVYTSTILVEPCCEAQLTEGGDVCVTVGSDPHCALGTELNTVQLSIFSHRFMSIAGEPGRREGTSLSGWVG